jgi:hypothetical protein
MRLLLERVRQAGASNSRVVVAIILFVLGILTVLLGTRTASSAPPNSLVSAGFNNSNYPGSYSGVEPLAQSANSAAFGSANYWNPLTLGYLSPETNPSFSFLKDSGGNLTTVGLQSPDRLIIGPLQLTSDKLPKASMYEIVAGLAVMPPGMYTRVHMH